MEQPEKGMFDMDVAINLAVALLIGALVGVDREKKLAEEKGPRIGGIRTFILYAEVGAVAALLSQHYQSVWMLVAGLTGVAASVLAGYIVQSHKDPQSLGMTTEVSAIVVCLLGALSVSGYRELAIMLAVITSAALAFKQPIHGLIEKFATDDIYAGMKLLIATFVVLPLLPDRTVDPWQALNPYKLWLLVILISGLSLVGYIATRWLGSNRGTAITGLTGGLVSSTAVTLEFSRRSKNEEAPQQVFLAAGILLAWGVMFVRVMVEVLVVNRTLIAPLLIPFSGMLIVAIALALLYFLKNPKERRAEKGVPLQNPFNLTSAMKFAFFFAVIQVIVKIAQTYWSGGGLIVVAGLAGLTDVDAITLSMAEYARGGGDARVAATSIVVASLSNTAVKCAMIAFLGSSALRNRIAIATLAIMVTGLALSMF